MVNGILEQDTKFKASASAPKGFLSYVINPAMYGSADVPIKFTIPDGCAIVKGYFADAINGEPNNVIERSIVYVKPKANGVYNLNLHCEYDGDDYIFALQDFCGKSNYSQNDPWFAWAEWIYVNPQVLSSYCSFAVFLEWSREINANTTYIDISPNYNINA